MVRETRHLWVANLPDNTREDRIREHFQRYGRVQSVKIVTSSSGGGNDTSPSAAITSTTELCCQTTAGDHFTSSTNNHSHHLHVHHRVSCSHGKGSSVVDHQQQQQCGGVNNSCNNSVGSNLAGSVPAIGICATIAFMDIKSASKAHLAEHKFDDRLLTTEYYEPSTMQLHSESLVINNKSENNVVVAGEMTTTTAHQVASRYTSNSSSHGSSDDHSPGYERTTSFYDRVSTSQSGNRNTEASTEYIRRNSYHSNDIRGRQRERPFKNSPYSLIVDRPNQIHRSSWYETSSPSPSSSRNHYSNNQTSLSTSGNIFQQPDSSYDRQNSSDLSDHQTSSPSPLSGGNGVTTSNNNNNNLSKESCKLPPSTSASSSATIASDATSLPYKSKLIVNNHHHHNHHKSTTTLKSRSGSESPVSGRSSRSHSRSPSSCSSTHSSHITTPTSSRDSNSSPITAGGDSHNNNNTPSSHHHSHHLRHLKGSNSASGKSTAVTQHSHSQRHRRNLQSSLASVPLIGEKPVASSTSSLSSSGSLSGSNSLGFYSEDNRPLAICVRNLPLRSSDTSLKDGLFHEYKKHGKVTWVKVVGQSHDRYALVCFKKPEDVDKALEVSQDKLFFGCKIEVQPYQGYDVDDNEFRPYEAELDEYQPKSTRTLFIGNLEKDITVTELRKHFECFGEILEIDIKKQGSSPYAFCQYADIVSVVKAVRKMDGEHLGSTRIKLGFGKSMPTTCVWFDNIAETVQESYLSQQCARFGSVQKVAIDRERRMGLVTYEQISSATQAVKEMRGIPLRGRKLQVDFASRECIEAFYARLEKREPSTINNNYDSASSNATSASSANNNNNNSNNNRYITNLTRSRASSFSRPGNPLSGTASPTSTPSAGSTPRHLSSSGNSISRKFRYGSPEFYDSNEYLDAYGNFENERVIEADHMIVAAANDGAESITSSTRRRCDKSPVVDGRIVQRVETECSGTTSSSVRRRCERSPGDVRVLESQRYKILNQLEKCPSSGDEAESPKKRAKYSQEVDEHNFNNHQDPSTTNCNGKVLDHREHSVAYSASTSTTSAYNHHHHRYHSSEVAHRKTVEIRRLSDCNIKHSASVPGGAMTSNYTKPSRRPSTDSLTRYTATQMDSYQLHKRRKTSAGASTSSSNSSMTANEMLEMSKRERVNPIQSFERESGGESEHGSRPDTPLIDERPDNLQQPNQPTDPRTNRPPRIREVLNLPLPKFAAIFHQQLREKNQLQPASHAYVEKHEANNHHHHHSSLNKHRSISPSPQVRSRSNSILPPTVNSGGSSVSETLVTSPHQTSMTTSSNSSDSEPELGSIPGPSTSPSLEERLKKLSEDYDSWSSNGRSSSSSHYMNIRHSVPEISIPETPDLLKNVLKNSMFDEDSKRLENINTQPPMPVATITTAKSNFGSFNSNYINISGTSSPLANLTSIVSVPEPPPCALVKLHIPSVQQLPVIQQPVQQPALSTVLQQRLGSSSTGSPMNSPNAASPYNSPNPSSASSISSLKGLQYPFPSHPIVSNASTSTVTSAIVSLSNSSSSSNSPITTVVSSSQKPKTCTVSKSISMQETPSATCTNNSNSNNFTASFNKGSTNNVNNSNNDSSTSASKLLVKSVSLPMPSPTEKISEITEIKSEIICEEKNENVIETPVESVSVKIEPPEKKEEKKERRKNSENEDEHSKKEKCKETKKEKSSTITTSKPKKIKDEFCDEKRDEVPECPPSPTIVQRSGIEDIDSAPEVTNHIEKSQSERKHHERQNKHHHHKERKNSKPHIENDDLSVKKNDIHSSKDSIFDELKRNSKDNIIKSNDKVHKSKKHHHHHRDGNKDKENQTQVHFNDTSSSIMTDDIINRSSEDDVASALKHNHNGKKPELGDDHEKKQHDEEAHAKKKHQRRNPNISISTDDTEESDGGTKRSSFFDIPDFEPNVSMYDKVKARSCKNVKKQEEEKKIKDKFTALKQSRAKREKKRLNTSEDDSDSDMHDTNSNDMFPSKYHKKSQLSGSDDDLGDSDDEILSKKLKSRNQLSICDDESSENGINDAHKRRNKVFNRKISRSNVIDSSDEEMPSEKEIKMVEIKQEPQNATDSFDELKKDHESKNNKHSSKKRHHEKNKDDKSTKKSKKVSKDHHRKSTSSTDSQQKREEDIFGSISSDDHKPIDHIEIKKEKAEDSIGSDDQTKERREESKKRKEKREKRREREKQRLIKQEDNSVDLDEAGRALEAQLMSDNEQPKTTNEKSDDVFHFTDDDIKHHDSNKKKKKKKRTKEDRKHHHNHHHYENIKQEPIVADNNLESNNNTKMKIDVVSSDEIKPSVPSLIEETSTVKKSETKAIPFGGNIDQNVHEKAVMSIAAELEKKPIVVVKEEVPQPIKPTVEVHEKKVTKPEVDKHEEKSRVVISQEETEDAVAALLGESFSMTHEEYNDPYDVPIVSNENDMTESVVESVPIAPEEDEEMKKAIMSLNSEIDRKIDTPTSEHELQIDTDTEEPLEDDGLNNQQMMSFDEPPKTPDIDTKVEKADISLDKSSSTSDESMKEETKVEIKKIETPVKVEVKKEEKRFHPPSITIPPEPSSIEKTSPRKSQHSPGSVKMNPLYSPITPASGKDSPSSIFSKNVVTPTQKLSPLVVSPSQVNSSGAASPKFIGIPTKVESKPIIIQPVQTSSVKMPIQQLPIPKPAENKEPIKLTTITVAEKKIDLKPLHPQNVPRHPQIIYPPSIPTPVTPVASVPIIVPKIETSEMPVKIEKKEVTHDSSHEDVNEESEGTSHDSSMEKETKKNRGGGKQRGRKTIASSPPQVPQEIEIPSSPQTRRGGKSATSTKRGRGGKAASSKIPVPNMASPATPVSRQQKTSESDVYEFHDDSGEESSKSGDQRPRLQMKISSAAPSLPVTAPPVMTTSVISQTSTSVVQSTPISVTSVPSLLSESSPESLIPPSPLSQSAASPAQSDDFAQPNNTRKSKRLLEKDGPRTSVDDTIDDVIRNAGTVPQIPLTPQQQQQVIQSANARATRATRQNAVPSNSVVPNIPVSQPAQVITATPIVDAKKIRGGKKQLKDRKISETSESENEKKIEKPLVVQAPQIINVEQKIVQITPPIAPVTIIKQLELPTKKESAELLIDPVTGELQKVTQSKEGQYVPVAENRAHPSIVACPIPPPHQQQQQQIYQVESRIIQEEKKIIQAPPVTHHNVIKVSSPVVLEPPKPQPSVITEPSHVIKPVITQNPQATTKIPPQIPSQQVHPHKSYIYSQSAVKPPMSIVTTSPATTVISSQANMMKMAIPSGTMVQQPATIYNLPNIIPQQTSAKYIAQIPQSAQPKTAIVLPQQQQTIIHPTSSQQPPQIIHQKIPSSQPQQIVIHPQSHPQMASQSSGNLMINIPTSSSGQPGISSPRMTVKQVIRAVPQQPPTAAASVLVKSSSVQGQHPMPHQELAKARPTYIQQGNKLIEAYVPPGSRGDVIFVEGKHTMYPNYQTAKYPHPQQPVPSPTQNKPAQIIQQVQAPQTQPKIVEKIPSQPSVSIQHIPMSIAHQQKVYLTNSGQVIPMPQQPSQSEAMERQHWIEKNSSAQQTLKNRFVMDFEEAQHRAQQAAQQQQQQVKRIYVNEPQPNVHSLPSPSQQPHSVVQGKTVIGLNQTPQILTGAVASPPLKAHMSSQQPIVTGASSSRIAVPTASPKEQQQHIARHYPHEAYEESVMQHGDRSASYRSQSPPPAHQTSPLTTRAPYLIPSKLYPQSTMYLRGSDYGRMPISRIGLAPGATEAREMSEIDEPRAASPPLELRRTTSMPLQSPSDRITDSPMMAPALYASPRIPQPYFYDAETMKPPTAEPPPAHRAHVGPVYTVPQQSSLAPPTNLAHIQRIEHREHREKEESVSIVATTQQPKENEVRYQYVYTSAAQNPPSAQGLAPASNARPIQMTTPPIASQVPPTHPESLSRLLEVYPLMWQGLLALKTEQAAVQMHFVYGNKKIAKASLPVNADHTTPPLRIAQRMRMEPSQIEGVARKMQITDEHCILLALPCGFDYSDVLRQTENLQVSFINYLRSKQAAGIINIADPGSQNASYVVHIFPSCDFANESLERIAPDLMFKVANIAYLLIVIATV